MKPLLAGSEDNDALLNLGKASVQIVHDLKNQLNGLKLYATFLRKRSEKTERPADELETINKLIAGLDRTSTDLSMIVEYGQPLELKRQPGTDLEKIMRDMTRGLSERPPVSGALKPAIVLNTEAGPFLGEFDSVLLGNALKSISLGAMNMVTSPRPEGALEISLQSESMETERGGLIKWKLLDSIDHDPFHSFAGSNEIRLSLAARVIEAHGGSANRQDGSLCVRLPLTR
jgi:light-regulated signal transduction histidine kinase (bacteriophytochrome)